MSGDPVATHSLHHLLGDQCRELESAFLASTTTNLAAVLPFLMIGGFISLLFNELILTISFAVAASLVVALTLVPMISSRLLLVSWSSGIGQMWVLREFRDRLQGATRLYARTLATVLHHRVWAIALAVVVLGGGSWILLGQVPQEILPRIDTGQARLCAQFPAGTTLDDNRRAMAAIDHVLLEQPETQYVFTTAGGHCLAHRPAQMPCVGLPPSPSNPVQTFNDLSIV